MYFQNSQPRRVFGGRDSEKQKRREKKKKEREKLVQGNKVMTVLHKYTVLELLGSGGFGDVYKVEQETEKVFAMKTEMFDNNADKRLFRLKMETRIFSECAQIKDPIRKQHFVHMEDKGRTLTLKFLVMGLVGPSLHDIRQDVLQTNFTRSTALNVSLQTCQAVWDLHVLGYIHRDIKPQNFAIGLEDKRNTVYMLDFGISRKILDKNGQNKKPRDKAKFIGTVRYASRNCHLSKEQGKNDDMEGWYFMVIDLFDMHLIPWRGICDRARVLEMKRNMFKGEYDHKIHPIVPKNFRQIADYINGLKYGDTPDYRNMMELMKKIADEEKIDLNGKLDWSEKQRKKKENAKVDSDEEGEDSDDSRDSTDSSEDEKEKKKPKVKKVKSPSKGKKSGSGSKDPIKSKEKLSRESIEDPSVQLNKAVRRNSRERMKKNSKEKMSKESINEGLIRREACTREEQ